MHRAALLAVPLLAAPAAAQPRPVLGSTPQPTPAELAEYNRFVEGVVDPRNTLDLVAGRPRLVLLKTTPTRTQIADDTVATFRLLEPNGTQMTLAGRRPGTTVLNLWFADPAHPRGERVLSYLVRVFGDPEEKARMAAGLTALAAEVNRAFPDSRVRLGLVGDKPVLTGQAHDPAEAAKILRVVQPGGR